MLSVKSSFLIRFMLCQFIYLVPTCRPVVPGGAGGAPPYFGRSVNPILTKGGRLSPPTRNPGFLDLPTALTWVNRNMCGMNFFISFCDRLCHNPIWKFLSRKHEMYTRNHKTGPTRMARPPRTTKARYTYKIFSLISSKNLSPKKTEAN